MPANGQQTAAPDREQPPDASTDSDGFGFSISGLTSSVVARIRGLIGSEAAADLVRDIVDPAALTYNYYRGAQKVLAEWAQNTQYSGMVRVNEPLKPGFINLYILDHQYLERRAPQLACNCQYIPGAWTIVCDNQFLAGAQRLLNTPSSESKSDDEYAEIKRLMDTLYQNFLFEWILAHELGHLVHNHSDEDMHRLWEYRNGVSVGMEAEKEADEFYISQLQHRQESQFTAWMGLSNVVTHLYRDAILTQHTKQEIDAEIAKDGEKYYYNTPFNVKLKYAPDWHPPFLVRALNLANLVLARYPQMIDTSGYFDRVRDHIELEAAAAPDTPRLCLLDVPVDNDPSEIQLIAKHVQVLVADAAPKPWIDAAIAKLRKLEPTEKDPDWRAAGGLITDLSELATMSGAKLQKGLARVEAKSAKLPELQRAAVKLQLATVKARLGLFENVAAVNRALRGAEDQTNELIKGGIINFNEAADKAEALRVLLEIALARNNDRGGQVEAVVNQIFSDLQALPEVSEEDSRLLYQDLAADYVWVSHIDALKRRLLASSNAALRLAQLAERKGWVTITAHSLVQAISLLEQTQPPPELEIAINYQALAHALRQLGLLEYYPDQIRKALEHIDKFLASDAGSRADKAQATGAQLTFLNDLGWSLIVNRQFADAIPTLEKALGGRVDQRAGRSECQKDRPEDREFATVDQNLS